MLAASCADLDIIHAELRAKDIEWCQKIIEGFKKLRQVGSRHMAVQQPVPSVFNGVQQPARSLAARALTCVLNASLPVGVVSWAVHPITLLRSGAMQPNSHTPSPFSCIALYCFADDDQGPEG